MTILSLLTNGHADTSMGFDVLREDYSATVDIGEEHNEFWLNMLEEKGFNITHEKDTIYTIQAET